MKTLLVSVLLVGLALPAAAADRTLIERAHAAPLQVVAHCDSQSSRWEGGSIFTESDVSVLETVRGVPGQRLVVRQRGGEVDGIGQRVTHVSLLKPGRTYLLLLTEDTAVNWVPIASGVKLVDVSAEGVQTVAGRPLAQVLAELRDLGGVD
ncbi:MAG: hypothetical protein ACREQQ_09130 [Candidatus Binatia bacterium]